MNAYLTSSEITQELYNIVKSSPLYTTIPKLYKESFPVGATGEYVVVGTLSNEIGDSQSATCWVNIHVPNETRKIGGSTQQVRPEARLSILSSTARQAIEFNASPSGRYILTIASESIDFDTEVSQSIIRIRIKFIKH